MQFSIRYLNTFHTHTSTAIQKRNTSKVLNSRKIVEHMSKVHKSLIAPPTNGTSFLNAQKPANIFSEKRTRHTYIEKKTKKKSRGPFITAFLLFKNPFRREKSEIKPRQCLISRPVEIRRFCEFPGKSSVFHLHFLSRD